MTEYQIHLSHRRGELRVIIGNLLLGHSQYKEEAWREMYLRKADKFVVELLQVEREMEKENSRY
jgi:hypothetical protein